MAPPWVLPNRLSLLVPTEHSAPAKVVRAAVPKQRKGSKVRSGAGNLRGLLEERGGVASSELRGSSVCSQ